MSVLDERRPASRSPGLNLMYNPIPISQHHSELLSISQLRSAPNRNISYAITTVLLNHNRTKQFDWGLV